MIGSRPGKTSPKSGRLWLCVGPTALWALDIGMTLRFQPPDYARGNYACAVEGCPPFRWLLQQHPLAFLGAAVAGLVVYAGLLLLTPRRVAMAASIVIVLGHAWGTGTWLLRSVAGGYWLALGLFVLAGILITISWEKNMRSEAPQPIAAHAPKVPCPPTETTTPHGRP